MAKTLDGAPDIAEIAGIRLTHPDRVLWEEQCVTKRALAEFYAAIAGFILPHVVRRPLTLLRCPSGARKTCFVQRHGSAGLGDAVIRATVGTGDERQELLAIADLRGLVALVQSGVLEIHPWGATLDDLDHPDRIVFDFDPGPGSDWPQVVAGARALRERLEGLGLESFVKATGGRGLHVVVPVAPEADWDAVKAFASGIARAMAADQPELYTVKAAKAERTGRIFIDYLRNSRGASAVAPYSTRARAGAPVAAPLAWEELSPAVPANRYTVANLQDRLRNLARDPWHELPGLKQRLPERRR